MPTTGPDTLVRVAIGVLQSVDGRVLVATRDVALHQGGGLEFPGGKIEQGETAEQAIARELVEELGIRVRTVEAFQRLRHPYPAFRVELSVFRITAWAGEPVGLQGQQVHWIAPAELQSSTFPAANQPIVAALQWPPFMCVTPALRPRDGEAWWAMLAESVKDPDCWTQLRVPGLQAEERQQFLELVAERVADDSATRILVNGTAEDLGSLPDRVGLHLSARSAARLGSRPVAQDRFLSCACHNEAEVDRAIRIGADLLVIGTVLPTPTHPGGDTIGWEGLFALAERAALPVYAIGGLAPADLQQARNHGATGVAGVRAFMPRARGPESV